MNIFTRIKSWFTKEKAAERIVEVAQKTVGFLEDHQSELASAERIVRQAETAFTAPGSGALKWAYATNAMKTLWPELKPHLVSLLTGLAVNLLKGAK